MLAGVLPDSAVTLADVACDQAGIVTRQQAVRCGMTDVGVRAQLRGGRWRRVHPGVLATFTGPLPPASRLWAAVLACGHDAALSHWTAAQQAGLPVAGDGLIHVTVPAGRKVRAPAGVRVHRSRRLPADVQPATSPPRTRVEPTVLDLVGVAAGPDEAAALLAQAIGQRLTTVDRLWQAVERRRNLRWRNQMFGALLAVRSGAHSLLEMLYLRDVERAHGLPSGTRQARAVLDGQVTYADVRYGRFRARVELDGRRHLVGAALRRDLRRDNAAAVAGDVTLRYGWADVTKRPCEVARQVAEVLRSRGWDGVPRRCGKSCAL
jgi:hypothetical protein